jgi:hypothetical protein
MLRNPSNSIEHGNKTLVVVSHLLRAESGDDSAADKLIITQFIFSIWREQLLQISCLESAPDTEIAQD